MSRGSLTLALAASLGALTLAACDGGAEAPPTVTVTDPAAPETSTSPETSTETTETTEDDEADETEQTDEQSGDAPESPSEDEADDDGSSDDADTETDTDSEDDSDSGDDSAQTPAKGGSATVAAPGTEVPQGEPAHLHVQAMQKGEASYGYAEVDSVMKSVRQGKESDWKQFENGEQMAGYVPWIVEVESTWTTTEGKPNANMLPAWRGVTSSGAEVLGAGGATGEWGDCELDVAEFEVGGTSEQCMVLPLPKGETLAGLTWHGDDYADADDNPYEDDPVVLRVK